MIRPGMISGKTVKTHVSNMLSELSLLAAKSVGYTETVCVTRMDKICHLYSARKTARRVSLSELLVSVGILAILGVIARPSFSIVIYI